jgi:TPR repeat protein
MGPCLRGDGNACYAAALRVQELGRTETDSEYLFLRACRLGIASGCTNRAAGIMKLEENRAGALECATQTFDAMCKLADPWACSMLALNLWKGLGTKRDLTRALQVLSGSCRDGEDDPACQAAVKLKRAIESEGGH